MNILILMAGDGTRMGKDIYKPFVKTRGKSILKRTTESLPYMSEWARKEGDVNIYFAIREEHDEVYNVAEKLIETYGEDITIIKFKEKTNGNLETALVSCVEAGLNLEEELFVLDSDNAYRVNDIENFLKMHKSLEKPFASLFCFEAVDFSPKWCFAKMFNNRVSGIAEKSLNFLKTGGKPMVGTFYFSNGKIFVDAARKILDNKEMVKGEFYMSQSIQQLLVDDIIVIGYMVKNVLPLGTKEDVLSFESGFDKELEEEIKENKNGN